MLKRFATAVVLFAVTGSSADSAPSQAARGAVMVFSADVFTGTLDGLVGEFERGSAHKVSVVYGTAGEIRRRVAAGEFCDVVILPRPMLEELQRGNRVVDNSIVDLAQSAVGVAVRLNTPLPDISSVSAFTRLLATAESITYPNPDRGGATGVLVRRLLQQLGMVDPVGAKTVFPPPGRFAANVVAQGGAQIAISQPMEVLITPGVQLVGLLPAELQDLSSFLFSSGIAVNANEADGALAFVRFLTSPAAGSVFKGRGMNPVTPR